MILAVGSLADSTFLQGVRALVRSESRFDLIDIGQFFCVGELDVPLQRPDQAVLYLHNRCFRLSNYLTFFVRLPAISGSAPDERLQHRAEGLQLALSQLFSQDTLRVLNPPLVGTSNQAKLYHATALSRIAGVPMPRSCLTNDPEYAREFLRSCPNGAIYKGASSIKTWASVVDFARDCARLELLRACPTLFQERLTGPDVRVHVVGDHLFAEKIVSTELDYRCSKRNSYTECVLPRTISEGSLAVAAEIGAPLLGIDYKLDGDTGDWLFLEANTMPCFEGYDDRSGGAISDAIVDWLNS